MAQLAPSLSTPRPLLDAHDHEQVELELHHAVGQKGRERAERLEAFLFIPRNVGLNGQNYPRTDFYADLTSFVRADVRVISLAELKDTERKELPLARIAQGLDEIVQGQAAAHAVAMQVKLFGHAFSEALRTGVVELLQRLSELPASPSSSRESLLEQLHHFAQDARDALGGLRRLRRQLLPLAHAAPSLLTVFDQTDEYSSLYFDSQLALLAEGANRAPELLDGSCFVPQLRKVLAGHAAPEARYRRARGFLTWDGRAQEAGEYFSYRQGLLKKAVHQALWVEAKTLNSDQYVRNMTGMAAAGLAATWAVIAQLPMQFLKLSGSLQTVLVMLPIIAYVAKDRIKELTREMLTRRYQDYDRAIALSAVGLANVGFGSVGGELRERMRFMDLRQVPKEVLEARLAQRTVTGAELSGEAVLHYRRDLSLSAENAHAGPLEVRQIIRLNLRHFLTRMDEPEHRVRHFSSETGAFEERVVPKVYHLNVVARLGHEAPPTRWRLVLNKQGIVRVEEVA
jgi:hypothetical protein